MPLRNSRASSRATLMATAEQSCYHCGEALPLNSTLQLKLEGKLRPMCCQGCLAVASVIDGSGLVNYYRHRQQLAVRANEDAAASAAAWRGIDGRDRLWGSETKSGDRDLLLQVSGIRCAACAWLIRSHLEKQPGVHAVQVDVDTGFCRIQWDPVETRMSQLASNLFELGYTPHLPLAQAEEDGRRQERTDSLKRLGVAGLGMMQVMMYAVGLYAGEAYGIEPAARGFLSWVSLLVSLPVFLYSGRVFFTGAWRGIHTGRPGMDLPVALAIGLAFFASCYQFFVGGGEVWFDSVVMFIFFLTAGRHVELVLRQRNMQAGTALARLLPEWANRLDEENRIHIVPSLDLQPGDRVRVTAGLSFPADGILLAGETEVDEALLTGESVAIGKKTGDSVIAGSVNLSQSVDLQVAASHEDSIVSSLGRLLMSTQAKRRDDSDLPGWLVPVFITGVLLVTLAAWLYWQWQDPTRAFSVALAVLVASCPCALSLALPVVRSAASLSLLKQGILLTRPAALFDLLKIHCVVFDKTGTLTLGQPEIQKIELNPSRSDHTLQSALGLAAAMESHSSHALARAFRTTTPLEGLGTVSNCPGQGLETDRDGRRIRLGKMQFALDRGGPSETRFSQAPEGQPENLPISDQAIWLADNESWIARFVWSDTFRPGAEQAVAQMRTAGLQLSICSGDSAITVAECARSLQIDDFKSRQSPEDKIKYIKSLKALSKNVLMIGDGINDAPVLAAADVSITVHGASELANSAADLILTGVSLQGLQRCFTAAHKAHKLVRQNITWALMYNVSVLPLAVSGLLQPWMAALGMSASSLLVVLNATRMQRNVEPPSQHTANTDRRWVNA